MALSFRALRSRSGISYWCMDRTARITGYLYSTMLVCVFNDAPKLVQGPSTEKVRSVSVAYLSPMLSSMKLFILSRSIKPPLSVEELSSDTDCCIKLLAIERIGQKYLLMSTVPISSKGSLSEDDSSLLITGAENV